MQACVQGAPLKKQSLASVLEHLNESHKNISITFQSHVTKFDQKRYSRLFLLYVAMHSVLYERKASSWMAWLDNLPC